MKPNGYGIEHSQDVENVYHLRLMALLRELVRDRGYKGTARILEIDHRTVADSVKAGKLSRRARSALERALQEGAGSAAALQRERNERVEERVAEVAKDMDGLGKELRRRLTALERDVGSMKTGRRGFVLGRPAPPITRNSSSSPKARSVSVLDMASPQAATEDGSTRNWPRWTRLPTTGKSSAQRGRRFSCGGTSKRLIPPGAGVFLGSPRRSSSWWWSLLYWSNTA